MMLFLNLSPKGRFWETDSNRRQVSTFRDESFNIRWGRGWGGGEVHLGSGVGNYFGHLLGSGQGEGGHIF